MGTDIHMACEVRRDGKWHLVTDKVFLNPWYDPNSTYTWCQEQYTNIPYDGRNYSLFAILANVRNGYGFAGCKTGDGFIPISKPKGYPDDMCDELLSDIYMSDDSYDDLNRPYLSNEHSASYLTLQELLNFDWTRTSRSCGWVSEETYKDYIMKGLHPDTWCGGVSGQNIIHLTEFEMAALIQGNYKRIEGKTYYTFCYFNPKTYAEFAGGFYENTIPVLKTLIPEGVTEEDVRIVFDFDS